ncbi:Uncharacterised protein [Mycobacteroides abscessus subsp. abscessus]|nr:Uncharacterised protein [Mycobacteroides abscessus subsp. abscessus]
MSEEMNDQMQVRRQKLQLRKNCMKKKTKATCQLQVVL